MKKSVLSLIVILSVCLCLFAGCGKKEEPKPTPTTTTAAPTTTTTTKNPYNVNPYTGVYDIDPNSHTRPITVVLGNNWKSRPQVGLEKADMYIEIETEGGITRFLTVFANMNRLPDKIGPCRSARTPSVKVAYALGSVYCHAGGSTPGKAKIRSLALADLDGCNDDVCFWRDKDLMYSKGMEYSMMTGKTEVIEAFDRYGYDKDRDITSPFTFGDKKGDTAATKVIVPFSYYQTDEFFYDENTKTYTKYNLVEGELEKHVSADGTALEVSNIFICYASKSMENKKTCDFDMSDGTGYLITQGTSREIQYSITNDGVSFKEADGSDITVSTGKSYICIVNKAYREDTEIS